ncbi:MAG TPA: acyl-CoA synthetase [Acidimicrobiia bacterium]|nr:acyl-CoA synthetase [Acidimicrobiia bacterium]
MEALPELPSHFNIAVACVDRWVDEGHGDEPAIRTEDRVLTYDDVKELVDRLGNGFKALGLGRGDRFLIRLSGGIHFYAAFLAGLKIGAVAIPTPELLRERELRHIATVAKVRLVVTSDQLAGPIRALRGELADLREVACLGGDQGSEIDLADLIESGGHRLDPAETGPQDPAFILFSSGTTGVPKGIAHAHRGFNIAAGNPCGREGMGLDRSDVVFHPHDPAWSYSLGCGFLFPLAEGASIVGSVTRVSPEDVLKWVEDHRVSILACVPTFYRAILAHGDVERGRDLSSLRHCLSAGEPLTSNTFHEWQRRMGAPILDHIGQGEISMFCANKPGTEIRTASIGKPLNGYNVAVIDEEENPVVDEVGHLVISDDNPGLFFDYLDMPENWAETHRNGWYYTGDLARRDDEGYFWYVSRSDDLITSRGYLISPAEVEDSLVDHPAVLEAGVVGHPHEQWGEIVTAYVALQPGLDSSPGLEQELTDHVRDQLAPFKTPKKWVFLSELPKTSTGKILRRRLRESGR